MVWWVQLDHYALCLVPCLLGAYGGGQAFQLDALTE